MTVLHVTLMAITIVLLTLMKEDEGQSNPCSKITEFTITYPNVQGVACRPCPRCPPGEGLPEECGSEVPVGTLTDCMPCEANKTYSTNNDSSTCRPCNMCGLRSVVHMCTPFRNQVCGTSCPTGHFLDERHDGCTECYFCCDSVPEHDRLERCKELNMPRNKRCEKTKENKECKRLHEQSRQSTPTVKPVKTPTFQMNLSTKKETVADKRDTQYSKSSSQTVTTHMNFDTKTLPATKKKDYKPGTITLVVGLVIFVTVIALRVLCSKIKKARKNDPDQMGLASHHEDCDKLTFIPSEQGLIDLPLEVEKSIKKLDYISSGVGNWRDVGRKFKIPDEDLDDLELEYKRGGSPVKGVMKILHTKYTTPLQKFVTVIQEIERKDIADKICSFYRTPVLATVLNESDSTVDSIV